MYPAHKVTFYPYGGLGTTAQATPKMAKFVWGRPLYPFKFQGPIFCPDKGPISLCHAEKF